MTDRQYSLLANWLARLNLLAALILAIISLYRWQSQGLTGPLILLLGLLVVGPLEDWLMGRVAGYRPDAMPPKAETINQGTSLFLILTLIVASLLY